MTGRYESRPQVEFLEGTRNVKLLADFVFIDADDTRWAVPKDAVVDGASIPRLLWTPLGGPFDGDYRDASIVHDWFCDRRTRTWQETHRMFFDAMIASGVGLRRAKVLYFGVRWMGPRWEFRTTINTRLASDDSFNLGVEGDLFTTSVVSIPSPSDSFDDESKEIVFRSTEAMIENQDFDLSHIDKIAEARRSE